MSQEHVDSIAANGLKVQHLATLLTWAGRAAERVVILRAGGDLQSLGSAMVWAGAEIERRCAVISEIVSDSTPYGLATAPGKTGSPA